DLVNPATDLFGPKRRSFRLGLLEAVDGLAGDTIPLKPTAVLPGSPADFMLPAEVPIHATWAGMEAAAAAGLARHLGVSNFSAKKIGELLPHCKVKPEVNQVELHPLLRQADLVAYCASQGIHVTAYAPLGSGDRPAFLKAADAPVLLENPVIRSIAETHGRRL